MFDNVLSNAVKYADGDLSVALTPEGTVTFSNAAPSLSHVQAERLFDRFFTVDTAGGSTGLGLSIAKEIVQRHHGSISLAPHEGPGTTVRLVLPIAQEQNGGSQAM